MTGPDGGRPVNLISSVCVKPKGPSECGQNGKRHGSSVPMTGAAWRVGYDRVAGEVPMSVPVMTRDQAAAAVKAAVAERDAIQANLL